MLFLGIYLVSHLLGQLVDLVFPPREPVGTTWVEVMILSFAIIILAFGLSRYEADRYQVQLMEDTVEGRLMRRIYGPTNGLMTTSFLLEDLDLPRTLADTRRGLLGWYKDIKVWSKTGHAVSIRQRYFSRQEMDAFFQMLKGTEG